MHHLDHYKRKKINKIIILISDQDNIKSEENYVNQLLKNIKIVIVLLSKLMRKVGVISGQKLIGLKKCLII